jgi:hypothetical protein
VFDQLVEYECGSLRFPQPDIIGKIGSLSGQIPEEPQPLYLMGLRLRPHRFQFLDVAVIPDEHGPRQIEPQGGSRQKPSLM